MTDIKRRKFVTLMGATATIVPVSALVASLPSHAADLVDPESAQAKALQYTHETPDAAKNCSKCALFSAAGDESGSCPLFPGSAVAANGWCSAYVPKG